MHRPQRLVHRAVETGGEPERARCGPFGPVGQRAGTDQVVVRLRSSGRRSDHGQSLCRIGDVGGERGEHGRDLVAQGTLLVVDAHRHRTGGDERLSGELATVFEVLAQGARTHRQDHVVHLHPERILDGLGALERESGERHGAMWSDAVVPRRARSGERHRPVVGSGHPGRTHQTRDVLDRAFDQAERIACETHLGQGRVGEQFLVGGDPFGFDRLGLEIPTLRGQVVHLGHDLGTRCAVDGRVMHLDHESDPVVLQPFDDPRLPQGTGAVERNRGDLCCDVGQLAASSGCGTADTSYVVVEVEVGVLDPHRVVELERHLDQSSAERGNHVQPRPDVLLDRVEAVAPLHGRHVVDAGHGHVHVGRRGLHIQEGCVHSRQAFHGGHSSARA